MSLALTSRRAALLPGRWVSNELWRRARAVPSLDLRFADNKSLVDSVSGQNLITYTGASARTFTDSDGVIRSATTNLLLRSEEFGTWWLPLRASVSSNAAIAPDGQLTADKLVEDTTASNSHLVYSGATQGAGTYTCSVYAKAAGRSRLYIAQESGGHSLFTLSGAGTALAFGANTVSITNVGDGWYRCRTTYTASGLHFVYFQLDNGVSTSYTGDGTSGIYLWGAQLEVGSTATAYIPTGATINSAPRFDHNPLTGECLGLLVEEQRQNLLLQSEDFSTTWSGGNILAFGSGSTVNATTAPNGTTTADLITENTSNSEHSIGQTFTAVSGTTYTFSVFAKYAGSTDRITLRFTTTAWSGSINNQARFDLLTGQGTIVFGATSISSQQYPNGWWRFSMTSTSSANGTPAAGIYLHDIGGTALSYAGGAVSGIYIWGAQLEVGAFPTSYIPTTGTAATRTASLADVINQAIANNIRTLCLEFRSPASDTRGVVSLNDNTANERASVITSGTDPRLVVHDGGVEQANINGGTVTANQRTRIAVRINANDFAISINGGTVVTDNSGTLPTVDRLMLGRTQAGEYLNAPLARVIGWQQLLPDSTLQELSR